MRCVRRRMGTSSLAGSAREVAGGWWCVSAPLVERPQLDGDLMSGRACDVVLGHTVLLCGSAPTALSLPSGLVAPRSAFDVLRHHHDADDGSFNWAGVPWRAALPLRAGTATSHGRPARLGSTPSNGPCRRLRAR